VPIANALRRSGETVAIEGVVTAPAGLLDADSRRVTIQDASAAILVRLPADASSVELGQKLLLVGEIGSYYGAPQMAVTEPPVALRGGGVPAPVVVRTAKLAANLEWRLVSVTGLVTSVLRDGEAWKAEIEVGGAQLPVSGIARSGIPSTALVIGRSATVIGVVKRPYPTSSDQRYALVPRMPSDIKLGAPRDGASPAATGGSHPLGGSGGSSTGGTGSGASVPSQLGPVAIALADIAAHESELVLVGGRVTAVDGERVLIDDGTSLAALRLTGSAPSIGQLRTSMLVNARGVVVRTDHGGLEIVVDDLANIRLLDPTLTTAANLALTPAQSPIADDEVVASPTQPTGNQLTFALAGLLVIAGMVGSAGLAVARKPQLVRAVKLAMANMRTRN
jgi:hypothetical protein